MKLIITILTVAFMTGCNQKTDKKNIVNTWKLVDLKYDKEIPKDKADIYKESIDEMKANFTLVYNSDNTYESHFKDQITEGTYEVSEDCKRITARDKSGFTNNYEIVKLTTKNLEFKSKLPVGNVTFVMVSNK